MNEKSHSVSDVPLPLPAAQLIPACHSRKDFDDKGDLTDKALRDWWLASARKVCADPAIDGLFLDGVVKVLEPGYLSGDIGREKKAAELAGYETMMKDARQIRGPDKLMVANVLRARFPDSGLSYLKAFDSIPPHETHTPLHRTAARATRRTSRCRASQTQHRPHLH